MLHLLSNGFWGNLSNIVASVVTATVGIASSVVPGITPPQITPTSPRAEIMQQNIITRSGKITYSGQSVKYSINVPKNGGQITGYVSGVCKGSLTGNYDGIEGGKISGKTSQSCGIGFIRKTFNITFNGKLYLKQGKIDLNWEGNIPSTPGKGSYSFNFEPEK